MKRRAFLAGLIGLPVAAKTPLSRMAVERITIRYTANDIEFLESWTYRIEQTAKIYRVDPKRLVGLKSNGQLVDEAIREYSKATIR